MKNKPTPMKTTANYKMFLHDMSLDELQYNSSLWMSELEFINFEVSFIKHLIKSYPIKSKIPNLFEHLQLFIQELDTINKENNTITNNIQQHTNLLSGMIECDSLSCDNFYVVAHEKLAEEVFNYLQTYKKLKIQIYEYLTGIMD